MNITDYLAFPVLFSDQKREVEEFLTAKSWGRKAVLLFSREGRALGEICAQGGLAVAKVVIALLSAGDTAIAFCIPYPGNWGYENKLFRTFCLLEESGSHILSTASTAVFFVTNFFVSLFTPSHCLSLSTALIGGKEGLENLSYWTDKLENDIAMALKACYLNPARSFATTRRCSRVWKKFLLDFHAHVKETIEQPDVSLKRYGINLKLLSEFSPGDPAGALKKLFDSGVRYIDLKILYYNLLKVVGERVPIMLREEFPDRNENPLVTNFQGYLTPQSIRKNGHERHLGCLNLARCLEKRLYPYRMLYANTWKISEYLAPPVLFSDQKSEVEEFLTAKSWGRKAVLLFSREGRALGEILAQGGLAAGKTVMTLLSAGDAAFSYCLSLPKEESEECKFTRTARLLEESGSHLLSAVSAVIFFVANFFVSLLASSYCLTVSEALIGDTLSEDIFAKEETAAENKPYWTAEDIEYASKYWILIQHKPVLRTREMEGPTPSLEEDIATGLEICCLNPSATSDTEKNCRMVWEKFLLELYDMAKRTIEEEHATHPTFTGKAMSQEFLVRFCKKNFFEALFYAGAQKVDAHKLLKFFYKLIKRLPKKNQSELKNTNTNPIKDCFCDYVHEGNGEHHTGYIDLESVVFDKPLSVGR